MCPCVHAVSCFIYPFLPAGSPFFWLFQTPDSQVVLSPCLVKIFPGPKIKAFLFLFLYGQARTTVTKLRLVKTSFGPHLYIGPTENSHLVFFFGLCTHAAVLMPGLQKQHLTPAQDIHPYCFGTTEGQDLQWKCPCHFSPS